MCKPFPYYHDEIQLRGPDRSGVHYGGGKHAILLKDPETFAKVGNQYHMAGHLLTCEISG